MANRNSSTHIINEASPPAHLAPCHTMWNWLTDAAKSNADAQFAATTLDVARGARVIGTILVEHLTDAAAAVDDPEVNRTLLSMNDTESLARLMVFSLNQLYQMAEHRVERFNDQAEAGARA